ncbi:putative monocarboxylate transporter mch1, partial [Irineochytrium annulatum]
MSGPNTTQIKVWAQEVLACFPDRDPADVACDLELTRSIDLTFNRILDGTFLNGTKRDPSIAVLKKRTTAIRPTLDLDLDVELDRTDDDDDFEFDFVPRDRERADEGRKGLLSLSQAIEKKVLDKFADDVIDSDSISDDGAPVVDLHRYQVTLDVVVSDEVIMVNDDSDGSGKENQRGRPKADGVRAKKLKIAPLAADPPPAASQSARSSMCLDDEDGDDGDDVSNTAPLRPKVLTRGTFSRGSQPATQATKAAKATRPRLSQVSPSSGCASRSSARSILSDCDLGSDTDGATQKKATKRRKTRDDSEERERKEEKARKAEAKRRTVEEREMMKEEKKREREEKKREREIEKELQKREKERERAEKMEQKEREREEKRREAEAAKITNVQVRQVNKLRDKEDLCKELVAFVDRDFVTLPDGTAVMASISLSGCKVDILPTEAPIPNTITWRRNVVREWDEALDRWKPCEKRVEDEPFVLVRVTAVEWSALCLNNVGNGSISSGSAHNPFPAVVAFVAKCRHAYPGRSVILFIEGLRGSNKIRRLEISKRMTEHARRLAPNYEPDQRKKKGGGGGNPDAMRMAPLEKMLAAMLWLQMHSSTLEPRNGPPLFIQTAEQPDEIASIIRSFTSSIAAIPERKHRAPRAMNVCFGDKVKSGTDLKDTWKRCLMEIKPVTDFVADAIVERYPTFRSLWEAYKGQVTEAGKEGLLQDILVSRANSERRIGPSLSRKIYICITTDDPDLRIHDPAP